MEKKEVINKENDAQSNKKISNIGDSAEKVKKEIKKNTTSYHTDKKENLKKDINSTSKKNYRKEKNARTDSQKEKKYESDNSKKINNENKSRKSYRDDLIKDAEQIGIWRRSNK